MIVLVTGARGLIGSALAEALARQEHEVVRLPRSAPAGTGEFQWDPDRGAIDRGAFEGVDAVVHLAGETVAGRWSDAKKRRIRDSRVNGTRLVSETMAALDGPPPVLVCASAIGLYGDRGDERLTESSAPGSGFLADVVREWEAAADPARAAGIRVVHTRFGIVQSAEGGALKTMLPIFRLGLGGRLGSGRQYVSWVSIDDTVGAIGFALARDDVSGALNVTAPEPVTQAEHARTLGRVLGRPALLPAPGFAVRAVLGEFAGEVLTGARVLPARLGELGYAFRHRELEPALRDVLERPA
ncbi:MAG TPA: TIGR01777 family oxidoreductase [Methylomirabilota bacterium]